MTMRGLQAGVVKLFWQTTLSRKSSYRRIAVSVSVSVSPYPGNVEHKLTDEYLADEIAGRPAVAEFINHADVYSAVPDELVSGLRCVSDRDNKDACYIISSVRFAGKNKTRKLRRIDGDPRKSYWHSEGGKTPLELSEAGGYVQDLVQAIKGTGGRTERTGWRMKEYGLSTEEHGDSHLVLCKVYHTPRNPPTSSAAPTVPVYSDPTNSCKKRKAADADNPEAPSSSVSPRITDAHPTMANTERDEQLKMCRFEMCRQWIDDERIRALMPNAPDPKEDLDGFMKCCEELVKETVAEAPPEIQARLRQKRKKKAPPPEPEMDSAAPPPSSFFQGVEQEFPFVYHSNNNNEQGAPPWAPSAQPQPEMDGAAAPPSSMEQEFPFMYPSHNVAVTEEAVPAWAPRCSDNVMMPWHSSMHIMH